MSDNNETGVIYVDDASPAGRRARLAQLETEIADGLAEFFRVGNHLIEIRDNQLYRDDYPTWEAYCIDRWHFTDRRALQLVTATRVTSELYDVLKELRPEETKPALPQNENQVRELAKIVNPYDRAKVWLTAVSIGSVSGADIAHITLVRAAMFTQLSQALKENRIKPKDASAVAQALKTLPGYLGDALDRLGIHDAAVIYELFRLFKNGAETFNQIVSSGYLQDGVDVPVKADQLTLPILKAALQAKSREYRDQAVTLKLAGAGVVEVVTTLYRNSPEKTIGALRAVLPEEELREIATKLLEAQERH